MNNKILNVCLITTAISSLAIVCIFAYKTFYFEPKNEWKLISEEDHVYILKNYGEDICYVYTNTASMITGKWVKTHCDN